ncbi:MAG: DegT/DnrJ/EryC1/StrS family aminotransferase, partial [Terriglobia bacterium]
GEFQGAILRVQLQRYPQHLQRRQANAAYLEQVLSEIEGITTLEPDSRVTANAYHIFFLRYHAEAFGGAAKTRFIAAMQAEGFDGVHGGYSLPVYRQPVLLAENFGLATPPLFGGGYPHTPEYQKVAYPVTDRACAEEAIWLRHNMLLGERRDIDDIVAAICKIQCYKDEL